MDIFSFNMIEIILLSATGLFLLIQLLYYYGTYHRIHAHNKAVEKGRIDFSDELPPISVIIRACNESGNLRLNLESILQQDYPTFEVIVINDGSTDESQELLAQLETKYNNLYHSFTPAQVRNLSNRKLAITLGIKASKYDWLVFTEAKCLPISNQWLRLLARNFTKTTDIVLGYSGYTYEKGWHNKLVCFDNIFQSMRYLGMALNDKPYMGIGRNLAYRKHLFFDNKGFGFLDLEQGEDDLFINSVANDINTRVESSKKAVTIVHSETYDAIDWKRDKINYQITSKFYRGTQLNILGFETFSRFLLYGASTASIVFGILDYHWLVVGIAFLGWLIRYINQAIVVNKTLKDMGEKYRYYLTLPFFDFILPLQHFFRKFSRLMHKENYRVNDNYFTHSA